MDKEFLWNNKEFIIKKLYIMLGFLLLLYLIVNLYQIDNKSLIFNQKDLYSNDSEISSEYIPAEVTYTE